MRTAPRPRAGLTLAEVLAATALLALAALLALQVFGQLLPQWERAAAAPARAAAAGQMLRAAAADLGAALHRRDGAAWLEAPAAGELRLRLTTASGADGRPREVDYRLAADGRLARRERPPGADDAAWRETAACPEVAAFTVALRGAGGEPLPGPAFPDAAGTFPSAATLALTFTGGGPAEFAAAAPLPGPPP